MHDGMWLAPRCAASCPKKGSMWMCILLFSISLSACVLSLSYWSGVH